MFRRYTEQTEAAVPRRANARTRKAPRAYASFAASTSASNALSSATALPSTMI